MRKNEKLQQEVIQLEEQFLKWLTSGIYSPMEKVLSEHATFLMGNGALFNTSELLAALRWGQLRFESMVTENCTYQVLGYSVLVYGNFTYNCACNGRNENGRFGRFTRVYHKEEDRWKLYLHQETYLETHLQTAVNEPASNRHGSPSKECRL